MKKQQFLGLSVILLTFCLVLAGCDGGGGDEPDTWSNITNLIVLNGTWQGSMDESMTIGQFAEKYGNLEWYKEKQAELGNINVNRNVSISVSINTSIKSLSEIMNITYAFSGSNIAAVWPEIKASVTGPGVTFDDPNHSLILTYSDSRGISDEVVAGIQINQKENKLRQPASDFGFEPGKYFIYYKQ